jgi:hypothetical protein
LRNIHRHCHFDERLRPTEANLKRARKQLVEIKQRIAAGTFVFAEEFPDYRFIKNLAAPQKRRACDQVFDEFLTTCDSRVAKKDMAFVTNSVLHGLASLRADCPARDRLRRL